MSAARRANAAEDCLLFIDKALKSDLFGALARSCSGYVGILCAQAVLFALAILGADLAKSPDSLLGWIIFWSSTFSLFLATGACLYVALTTREKPANYIWLASGLALGSMLAGEVLENIDYLRNTVEDFAYNDIFFFATKFLIVALQFWALYRLIKRQKLRKMVFDLIASISASGTILWFVFLSGNATVIAALDPLDLVGLQLSAILDTVIIFNVFTLAMRPGPEGTTLNYGARLSLLLAVLFLSSGELQWVIDKLNGRSIGVSSISVLFSHLSYMFVSISLCRFTADPRPASARWTRLSETFEDLAPFIHVLVALVLIFLIGFYYFQPGGRILYVALVFTVVMLMIRQAISFRERLNLQTQLAVNFAEAQLHSWYQALQPGLPAQPSAAIDPSPRAATVLTTSLWLSDNDRARIQSQLETDPTGAAVSYDLLTARTRNLTAALELGWFTPWYQPIYDAAAGKISSLELLLRCSHPEHGLLEPKSFIPELEAAGLSGQAIRRVLPTALSDQRTLQDHGVIDRLTTMAVNITARDLEDFRFVDDLARLLETHEVPNSRLCLELTERMVADLPIVESMGFQKLRKAGVQFCIDDFGTGYSSLAYLDRFQPDIVKIDRCFVTDIEARPGLAKLVHTIVDMAGRLGIRLVVEGVETPGQFAILRDMGCRYFQGYLFARPMPLEMLLENLQSNAELAALQAGSGAPKN